MNTISINIIASVLLVAHFITVFLIKPVSINFYSHSREIKKASKVLDKLKHFPETAKFLKILNYLRKIDPYVFEEFLLTTFEKQGYSIERGKKHSGNGGIDEKMSKDANNLIKLLSL